MNDLRFIQDIAEGGIEWALEKTTNITEEFTPPYFNQELQGLADASGLDFKMLQNIHMLGELTKVLFASAEPSQPQTIGCFRVLAL